MPDVTYIPDPGDPAEVETHGMRFKANVPTDVPEDHPFLKQVETNRFFALGDGKRGPGRPKGQKPPTTAEEYFPYAVAWIKGATSSGEIESRWANEEPVRKSVGWGSSDDEKIEPIKSPAIDVLKKRERQ